MNQLILAIILTILPISELRLGLPLALDYALKNNLSILPIFLMIVLINILVVFLIMFFLDFIHHRLLKFKFYARLFNFYIKKIQKRTNKVEKNFSIYGYLALTLFVAIPLPVTGAWTGTLISWILGLDRKKSLIAISLGVLIAGIIILIGSLGLFSLF